MCEENFKDDLESPSSEPDSRFNTQIQLFQKTIDSAEKSAFPEAQKIAKNAELKLSGLQKSKDKNKAIIEIITEIDKLQATLAYFAYNKCVEEIKTQLKKETEAFKTKHAEEVKSILEKYPQLPLSYRTKLETANTKRNQSLVNLYNQEYLPEQLTQTQFLKNSEQGYQALAQAQELKTAVLENILSLEAEAINQEFEDVHQAIIFTQLAETAKESEEYINDQANQQIAKIKEQKTQLNKKLSEHPANKLSQLSDKEMNELFSEQFLEFQQLQKEVNDELSKLNSSITEIENLKTNSLAILNGLNVQKENKKRTVVIAYFQDQLNSIVSEDRHFKTNNFETALQLTGQKKDFIANKFLETELVKKSSLSSKVDQTGILKLADFRLEGTGFLLGSNVGPERPCRLVDEYIYQFKNEQNQLTEYVRVQLDPPNGPIGYSPLNSLDLKKQSKNPPKLLDVFKKKKLPDFFKNDPPPIPQSELMYPKEVTRKLAVFNPEAKNTVTDWLTKNYPDALQHLKSRAGDEPTLEQLVEVGTTLYIEKNPTLLNDIKTKKISINDAFDTALDEIVPDWEVPN